MSEVDISTYFNEVIARAIAPARLDAPPVLSVYINREKCFAFVELTSIELTTACCQLDGIQYSGCQPPATLRIRRPNDYMPNSLPPNIPPPPVFNMAALGIISTTVADGPNKVFIGGLPYHLTEDNVKELLSAFGALKSFHLVKEAGASQSKGYGFCEYVDSKNTQQAVNGLNGMSIGDKTLTVRLNNQSSSAPSSIYGGAAVAPVALPTRPPTRVRLKMIIDIDPLLMFFLFIFSCRFFY
jgi:splicing factor U2AF subunit